MFGQQRDGGADLAGGAVAALEAIMAHERGLHRIESALFGQALDGGDLVTVMHHRECQSVLRDFRRAAATLIVRRAVLTK